MALAVERGELHAGPLPIAEVMRLGDSVRPLGNLGVASDGPALSVILFSRKPVEDLSGSNIAVTTHTATSIQLVRVLFADLWNVTGHRFVEPSDDHDAVLVIGDPALEMLASDRYPHQYDLGTAWKSLTGLAFIFAEWVVRSDVPTEVSETFERQLVEATRAGMNAVDEISSARVNEFMNGSDVARYVCNFTYFLGTGERAGQLEFKKRLSRLPVWRPGNADSQKSTGTKAVSTS
jgi:chorismate dehydratase